MVLSVFQQKNFNDSLGGKNDPVLVDAEAKIAALEKVLG
jgi:hypothetical protein